MVGGERLAATARILLHPESVEEHLERYEVALEAAVAEGFLLEFDAPTILAFAGHGSALSYESKTRQAGLAVQFRC